MNATATLLRQIAQETERLSMVDGGKEYQHAIIQVRYWANQAARRLERGAEDDCVE